MRLKFFSVGLFVLTLAFTLFTHVSTLVVHAAESSGRLAELQTTTRITNPSTLTSAYDTQFSPDGLTMYVLGSYGQNLRIYQYGLSEAWKPGTINSLQTYAHMSAGTPEHTTYPILRFKISPDGKTVVWNQMSAGQTHLRNGKLMRPWDIGTLVILDKSYDISSDRGFSDFEFSEDGKMLWVISNKLIYQINLSDAWDISAISREKFYDTERAFALHDIAWPYAFTWNANGTVLYVVDGARLYAYTVPTAWNLSSVTEGPRTLILNEYVLTWGIDTLLGDMNSPRSLTRIADGTQIAITYPSGPTIKTFTLPGAPSKNNSKTMPVQDAESLVSVLSLTPTNGTTQIPLSTKQVVVRLSEPVYVGSGFVYITNKMTGEVVVHDIKDIHGVGTNTLTIPLPELKIASQYRIQMDSSALVDASQKPLAVFLEPLSWTFITDDSQNIPVHQGMWQTPPMPRGINGSGYLWNGEEWGISGYSGDAQKIEMLKPGELVTMQKADRHDDKESQDIFDWGVLYIDPSGRGRHINSKELFFNWFSDLSRVREVGYATFVYYSSGDTHNAAPVLPKTGTLVKDKKTPHVYMVEGNDPGAYSERAILRWIPNEKIAERVAGSDWNKRILEISPWTYGYFQLGDPVQ